MNGVFFRAHGGGLCSAGGSFEGNAVPGEPIVNDCEVTFRRVLKYLDILR